MDEFAAATIRSKRNAADYMTCEQRRERAMAMGCAGMPRIGGISALVALTIALLNAVGAQTPADLETQLQSLNAQAVEALQAGEYKKGAVLVEQALDRTSFLRNR
jgi:hypothetical protein